MNIFVFGNLSKMYLFVLLYKRFEFELKLLLK